MAPCSWAPTPGATLELNSTPAPPFSSSFPCPPSLSFFLAARGSSCQRLSGELQSLKNSYGTLQSTAPSSSQVGIPSQLRPALLVLTYTPSVTGNTLLYEDSIMEGIHAPVIPVGSEDKPSWVHMSQLCSLLSW